MKTKFFQIIGIIVVVSIALTNVNLSYNNTPKASDIELNVFISSALASNTESAVSGADQKWWQQLLGIFSGGGSYEYTKVNASTTVVKLYNAKGDSATITQSQGGGVKRKISFGNGNSNSPTDSISSGLQNNDELYKALHDFFK